MLVRSCSLTAGNLTFIGARRDGNFRLRVQLASPEGRVGVRDGLLEPRPALGGAVLVALDAVESVLGRVDDERGRVVAIESLAHVHNGLLRRSRRGLVDDRPTSHG